MFENWDGSAKYAHFYQGSGVMAGQKAFDAFLVKDGLRVNSSAGTSSGYLSAVIEILKAPSN
jgi:hypothetical protein